MTFTDSETKFVDKAGLDHTIEELKNYVMEQIENIDTGDIDLSDYVTQEQLQDALDALDIDIDLSAYATKEELQQAIAGIDLSGYATTEYVDNAIANIPTGGDVDLSDYYTKEEAYNKEEIDNLIPSVTDGKDGEDGFSPTATVTKEGKTATITITDKNGTTTASISDGKDGTGGGGSGGGEVYSTEETEVGTWIDGRTIYRKTYVLEGTEINKFKYFDIDTEFDDIISISAINSYKTSNSISFKPLNICEYDSYLNISSNSTSNIKDALTKKCQIVYILKNSAHPMGSFYTWFGSYGGDYHIIYVTIEYTKPIGETA